MNIEKMPETELIKATKRDLCAHTFDEVGGYCVKCGRSDKIIRDLPTEVSK